ncbi:MAG: fibronectin type III domain-containing protein [Candidatus Thorarchaeota archaeon]
MRHLRFGILLVVVLSLAGMRLDYGNFFISTATPLEFTRGPTVNLLNSSSVTLIWDTTTPTQTQVRYSTDPTFSSYTETTLNSTLVTHHRVVVSSGLLPNTRYYYCVGDGTEWSVICEFTTAPTGDEPFTFLIYGDHRPVNGIDPPEELGELIDVMITHHPQFVISGGDHIFGTDAAAWPKYVAETDRIHCNATYWVVMGNHDQPETDNMATWFEWPHEERGAYYSFDYGNAHFVIVNPYEVDLDHPDIDPQTIWLENDLAATTAKHRFVICHLPFFPTGPHIGSCMDYNVTYRDELWQLFEECNVEAVFVSHEHFYYRLQVGTIPQITTGGGGAPLYNALLFNTFATEVYKKACHFIRVDVNGDEVAYTVIDKSNTTIDTFTTTSSLSPRPSVSAITHTLSHPLTASITATVTPGVPIVSVTCKYRLTTETTYTPASMTLVDGNQYAVDMGPLADQQRYYYYIEVNDTAEAVYQSVLYSFAFDETPPTVSFLSPDAGAILHGNCTVMVHGEDAFGISHIEIYLNDSLVFNTSAVDANWVWNTTTALDGKYTLKAIAYDRTGNTAETSILVFVVNEVDLPPPPPLPVIPIAIGIVISVVVIVVVIVIRKRQKARALSTHSSV